MMGDGKTDMQHFTVMGLGISKVCSALPVSRLAMPTIFLFRQIDRKADVAVFRPSNGS